RRLLRLRFIFGGRLSLDSGSLGNARSFRSGRLCGLRSFLGRFLCDFLGLLWCLALSFLRSRLSRRLWLGCSNLGRCVSRGDFLGFRLRRRLRYLAVGLCFGTILLGSTSRFRRQFTGIAFDEDALLTNLDRNRAGTP